MLPWAREGLTPWGNKHPSSFRLIDLEEEEGEEDRRACFLHVCMYVCMYVCISMYVQYISICPEAIILYVCMYILHMYGHGRGIWGGGAYCSRGRPYSAPHRCVCNLILPPPLLPISSFTLEDVVSTTGFLCPRWSWSWQGVLLGQGPFWATGERDRGSDAPNTTTHHPNGRAWCHFHYLYCCHHRHCSRFLS